MTKLNKFWLRLSQVSLILGALCLLNYTIIGSHVDSDGILREPFFLIPIGLTLLCSTILFLAIAFFKRSK